ncbi:MAG: hypothetical protein WC635_17960 [Bacteriovorax sp.]
MLKLLTTFFGPKKNYKIQSFTFFIPSPPPRTTGYREKQFDKLFYEFINKGYKILNFSTQASTGEKQSGMWILFVLQAQNKEAEKLNLDDLVQDSIKSKAGVKEAIEGFYYIDDRAQEND